MFYFVQGEVGQRPDCQVQGQTQLPIPKRPITVQITECTKLTVSSVPEEEACDRPGRFFST